MFAHVTCHKYRIRNMQQIENQNIHGWWYEMGYVDSKIHNCDHKVMPGGGGTDLESGYGDVRPWRPLFTPLLPLARVPFQAKESVHKTPFWENLEILASTASIFTQILAHKPPNLEIFSSQAPQFGNFPLTSPPFQRQMSVCKPHTLEIRAAHPYLKKSWVPPPPPGVMHVH